MDVNFQDGLLEVLQDSAEQACVEALLRCIGRSTTGLLTRLQSTTNAVVHHLVQRPAHGRRVVYSAGSCGRGSPPVQKCCL